MRVPGDVHRPSSKPASSPTRTSAATSTPCAGSPIATGRSAAASSIRGDGPWTLVVDVLDTIAEIRLNGTALGGHPLRLPRSVLPTRRHLVQGENRIEITFLSAPRAANALAGPATLPGALQHRQLPDPEWQHAAQAAVRLRLGLGHRAGAGRPLRPRRSGRPRGLIDEAPITQRHAPAASPSTSKSPPPASGRRTSPGAPASAASP